MTMDTDRFPPFRSLRDGSEVTQGGNSEGHFLLKPVTGSCVQEGNAACLEGTRATAWRKGN